jgi:pyruvate/2-oxoglutarate dehydrogenase complex dihydrolipoamide dehydrogenase (E3) component
MDRRSISLAFCGLSAWSSQCRTKYSISSASAAAAAVWPARSARPNTAPRTAVIESHRLGGTCVNVGCVPKKIMWNAAGVAQSLTDAKDYGFDVTVGGNDWPALKAKRDAYVLRLNGIYERNLKTKGVASCGALRASWTRTRWK